MPNSNTRLDSLLSRSLNPRHSVTDSVLSGAAIWTSAKALEVCLVAGQKRMITKEGSRVKAGIYAEPYLWNKNADALIRMLQLIDALGSLHKQTLRAHEVQLEEVRAIVNSDLLETLLMRKCVEQRPLNQQRNVWQRVASGETIQ